MYAESTEWGANCGVAFPLRNLPGSPLGAMVGITRLDAPEFRRWWSRFHRELHLAALGYRYEAIAVLPAARTGD